MITYPYHVIALFALWVHICPISAADDGPPVLHPLFGSHAVIQRGRPLAIWGWATPGREIVIRLSGDAEWTGTTIAGSDGRWRAATGLTPHRGSLDLVVSAGGRSVEARDLAIGDLWVCGGQSNMEWSAGSSAEAAAGIAAATPAIRRLRVPHAAALTPTDRVNAAWQTATRTEAPGFSAVGLFFAIEVHRRIGVPIGLLECPYSGSPIESWLDVETLAAIPGCAGQAREAAKLLDRVSEQEHASGGIGYAERAERWYRANDPGSAAQPTWADPGLDDREWTACELPGLLEERGALPAGYRGTAWLRRVVTVPPAAAGRPARLMLGSMPGLDTVYLNGRLLGTREGGGARTYAVPAGVIVDGRNVLAIRAADEGGAIGFRDPAPTMAMAIEGGSSLPLAGTWHVRAGTTWKAAPPYPETIGRRPIPVVQFNGMLAPLAGIAPTGVLWYQGESNAINQTGARLYRQQLTGLIGLWRRTLANPDLPFHIVQLPNFEPHASGAWWPLVREAQASVADALPGCGLAVTIDLGDPADIHPRRKQEVGRRLALQALSRTYLCADAVAEGPRYGTHQTAAAQVTVSFVSTGALRQSTPGSAIRGFSLAGADQVFHPAAAQIAGTNVIVTAAEVAAPVAVRYAWADAPTSDLTDGSGLPARPFRTDSW